MMMKHSENLVCSLASLTVWVRTKRERGDANSLDDCPVSTVLCGEVGGDRVWKRAERVLKGEMNACYPLNRVCFEFVVGC